MKRQWFRLALMAPLFSFATACGGDEGNEVGAPSFAGKTYLLNVPATSWTDGRGGDIGPYVPQFVMTIEGREGDYNVLMGAARDGKQEMCNPTTEVSVASDSYPGFVLGPTDFPLYIRHQDQPIAVESTIYELTIRDTLPEGNATTDEGELTGVMDFREVYPLFTQILPEPTPERVCYTLIEADVGECEACPSDGEEFCLTVKAIYLGAQEASSFTIEPVSDVDASCLELE
jgi:hypothetical protein